MRQSNPVALSRARVAGLYARAYGGGAIGAAIVLMAALWQWSNPGQPVPPSLTQARFSVAVLAGPKQAAQTAPENADQVVEATVTVPTPPKDAPVVVAERETSLPEAKKAAQSTAPSPAPVVKPVEVLPPARVSMPGGKLMAEDAPIGDGVQDPFAIKPRQVFIRLLVDKDGKVTRSGIVRSGGEPMRDGLILKAMASRTYTTENLLRIAGDVPTWQVDMVIDYGTNDFLP